MCAAVIALGIGETRSPRSDTDPAPRLIHWQAVPASIGFFEKVGLDYVSCSPYRVPVARLAAAQAALQIKVGD